MSLVKGDLPFGPSLAPVVPSRPKRLVQKGVGPGDGIAAGVDEAGCGVQLDQDLQEIVVEAGGVQLQRTGFGPFCQPAAHTFAVEPATLPGDETHDGLGYDELIAPAEGPERDASEVVPDFIRPTPMR